MKRKHELSILILTMIIAAMSLNINLVSSANTTIYMDPEIMYKLPGESFTIDIEIGSVEHLHHWQVYISFNSTVLRFINVTEGDFLRKGGRETTGFSRLDHAEEGWVFFTWAIFGKYLESGSGTLATVEFQVLANGESKLDVVTEPVWLDVDEDEIQDPDELLVLTYLVKMNPPPVPPGGKEEELLDFTATDGFFSNIVTPPVADFTYDPSIPMVDEAVTFNASASQVTTPLEIAEYQWDFDDGTKETYVKDENLTHIATHTFVTGGTFNITLTIIDNAVATELAKDIYNTTGMPQIWYNLYGSKTITLEVKLGHDIAVTNVKPSQEDVTTGETVSINVTVLNKGVETENFNVTAYYDDNLIEKKQVTDLVAGEEISVIFEWSTTGVAEGTYQIWAEATDIVGEGNLEDNKFIDGTVTLKAAPQSFPTTLVIGAVVAVAIVAVGLFMFMRRRSASPT